MTRFNTVKAKKTSDLLSTSFHGAQAPNDAQLTEQNEITQVHFLHDSLEGEQEGKDFPIRARKKRITRNPPYEETLITSCRIPKNHQNQSPPQNSPTSPPDLETIQQPPRS